MCSYAFAFLALLALPDAIRQMQTQGLYPLIAWLSQTFIQLVLLSVIVKIS